MVSAAGVNDAWSVLESHIVGSFIECSFAGVGYGWCVFLS